jgi:hypothetical protein
MPETPAPEIPAISKLVTLTTEESCEQMQPSFHEVSTNGFFKQDLESENKLLGRPSDVSEDSNLLNCSSSGFNTQQDSSNAEKHFHKRDTSDGEQIAITSAKENI